jgi:hypothetical protein
MCGNFGLIKRRRRHPFLGLFHGRQSSYFSFLVQVEPVTQVVTELVTELVNSTADTLHQIQVHIDDYKKGYS